MKRIELHTFQKAKKKKGYGIRNGLICAGVIPVGGYKRLSATARRISKAIGDTNGYPETELREKGLAEVCVITYEYTDTKTSETWDFFRNGRYSHTIKEIWTENGHTKNKYIKQ